jgi:hypothetical protein
MMNMQDTATFSIAVALPNYLKSLVERMLQSVLGNGATHGVDWRLSNSADVDVTLRLPGDGTQNISPNLLAEVRRRDGGIEHIQIEGPWRAGALAAALERIGRLLQQGQQRVVPDSVEMAWQWLQRWDALRSMRGTPLLELRIGARPPLLLDSAGVNAYVTGSGGINADLLIQLMARESWSLASSQSTTAPRTPTVSLKPLLWRLGLHAGMRGPLPGVLRQPALRLKGWPYLAAGGHKSYAELIRALRNGTDTHAALQALGLAPRSVVDGFLNACLACEFFHDAPAAAGLAANFAAAPAPISDQTAVIASIRRSLYGSRP